MVEASTRYPCLEEIRNSVSIADLLFEPLSPSYPLLSKTAVMLPISISRSLISAMTFRSNQLAMSMSLVLVNSESSPSFPGAMSESFGNMRVTDRRSLSLSIFSSSSTTEEEFLAIGERYGKVESHKVIVDTETGLGKG